MVQRLRIHLQVQGIGQIPGPRAKIPQAAGQLSPCTATSGAMALSSPCATARECPPFTAVRESPWAAMKTYCSQ